MDLLTECSRCHRKYKFDRKKGHSLTECNSCVVNKRREEAKKWAVEYKGGACENCGYNKCLRALCFHHIDPTNKKLQINAASAAYSLKIRQLELDKCVLLCMNCHMEKHAET
jgi:hypothetical protein